VDFQTTWIWEGNSLFPFMHKDKERYVWEKEFRIIIQQFPEKDLESDQIDYFECERENPDIGKVLVWNLVDLIETIVIAPKATKNFKEKVNSLATKYGLRDRCRESSIDSNTKRVA
jgi:hypothetical protein